MNTTERLHFHFSLSCIGEGNGNPLQCSCLENPRDSIAWRAAVYGVAQSQTRLSSSSSSRWKRDVSAILKFSGCAEYLKTFFFHFLQGYATMMCKFSFSCTRRYKQQWNEKQYELIAVTKCSYALINSALLYLKLWCETIFPGCFCKKIHHNEIWLYSLSDKKYVHLS